MGDGRKIAESKRKASEELPHKHSAESSEESAKVLDKKELGKTPPGLYELASKGLGSPGSAKKPKKVETPGALDLQAGSTESLNSSPAKKKDSKAPLPSFLSAKGIEQGGFSVPHVAYKMPENLQTGSAGKPAAADTKTLDAGSKPEPGVIPSDLKAGPERKAAAGTAAASFQETSLLAPAKITSYQPVQMEGYAVPQWKPLVAVLGPAETSLLPLKMASYQPAQMEGYTAPLWKPLVASLPPPDMSVFSSPGLASYR